MSIGSQLIRLVEINMLIRVSKNQRCRHQCLVCSKIQNIQITVKEKKN